MDTQSFSRCARNPVTNMIDGGIRGAGSARQAARFNHYRTAFLYGRNKIVFYPCGVVDKKGNFVAVNLGMIQVGILCWRNGYPRRLLFLMLETGCPTFAAICGQGTVMVEPHHAEKFSGFRPGAFFIAM